MDKSNNKIFIVKLSSILFAITFIATLLLTLCNYVTKGTIEELNKKTAEEAKQAVISGAKFEAVDLTDEQKARFEKYNLIGAYKASKDGKFAGYCIDVSPDGFGGDIDMIVGIDENINYTGIKIISMAETPGLGAKAQEKEFYGQFAQGKKGELTVKKNVSNPSENEIAAISGATITSDAVTQGANNALEIAKILIKEAE